MRMIQRGEADVVVAGGAEAALTGLCLAAFKRMGALSRRGVSCPFDMERDGFIMGEGAGALVLEAAEHATARGARVRGELLPTVGLTDLDPECELDHVTERRPTSVKLALSNSFGFGEQNAS